MAAMSDYAVLYAIGNDFRIPQPGPPESQYNYSSTGTVSAQVPTFLQIASSV